MIITREKGMRMWGGGSGSTSASGVNGGGGFSLAVTEGEGTGNAYTDFTYESGTLTLNKGSEFVTVDFFNKLFTAYDANGNVIAPNNTTPTLDNIKFKAGAWTEQYLSALGQNSSGGGGGGGIELSDVWQSLKTNTDDYANQKINSAHIPDLSGTYATKTWVNQQGFVTSSGVTSVAMTVPTGLSVSGSPITSTGTLALTFTSGYSIPTTAKQSNWDTAYGWGNHATAGYASASSVTTLQGYFTNGVAKTAAKLNTGTTTYTAWGQTYWSSGVPQSISGNMTSVGNITPSANGNALGTTSARFNIFGYAGNFSGNVSITGTLGVTGATTLTGLLTANGGIVVPSAKTVKIGDCTISWDSTNSMLKFDTGIYSTGAVSALGSNSSGGGSGTFDEEAMWTALGTNSTTKVIASSHIPNLAASKITSGTLADARIPSLAASKITSGTFAAARIPDLSGRYYALYGGTPLTGTSSSHYDLNNLLTVGSYYCTSSATAQYFDNKPTNDNWAFRVWVSAPIGTSSTYVRQRFQYYIGVAAYERYSTDSGSTWTGWFLIQAALANYALASSLNNYLPLSGGTMSNTNLVTNLNADLLDGQHASYFASAASLSNYVTLATNQTISGTKTFSNTVTISSTVDNKIIIDNTDSDTNYSHISFRQNGTEYGWLGTGTNGTTDLRWTGNILLHAGNYNSYAPSLTGTGASGTWGISISGTAAQANQVSDYQSGNGAFFASCQRGIGSTNTGALVYAYGSNPIRFYTNNTEKMRIADDGNVGIGTDSPPHKFSVFTSDSWACNIYSENNGNRSSFYASNAGGQHGLWCGISDNSASGTIAQFRYGITGNGSGGTIAMLIRGNGNVGIGTDSPSTPLHVKSSQGWAFHSYSSASSSFSSFYASYGGGQGMWCGTSSTASSIYLAAFYKGITSEGSGGSAVMFVGADGCVGIDTSSPSYALHVVGTIYGSGEITAASDARAKNILGNVNLDLKYMADAPNILYEWKNKEQHDDNIHVGSLAQYWLKDEKAKYLVSQGKDNGEYSLNYGALATSMAISIAKEVVKHEDRITLLEKENARLKARVEELEERRIA